MRVFDVAIAGGGPAGATAAALLARAGARVALIDSGATATRVEGVSTRTAALLDRLGLPAEGVGPPVMRRVRWGGPEQARNAERLVFRPAFDAGLRRAAAEAGARVIAAPVRRIDPARGRMTLADGSEIAAATLVEARGRRAPARSRRRGPATVAIAGFVGPAEADAASVEALPDGWVWRAGSPAHGLWTQLTLDAAAISGGRAGLARAWAAALGADAPFPRAPLARAAELRLATPRFDPALLRVGDAAVALDPLSGHGLFWALSSALSLPAMIHAAQEGETALAARFHETRVVGTFLRQARVGRDFHATAGFDGPFWRARRAWPDSEPAHAPVAAPAFRPQVVVADGRLVEAEALVTEPEPDGVAFVHGAAIAPLLRRVGLGAALDAADFARACPELGPARSLAIHAWAVDRGALRPRQAA